jgi:Tfp pilus assembly protein PilF
MKRISIIAFIFICVFISACEQQKKSGSTETDSVEVEKKNAQVKVNTEALSAKSVGLAYLEENQLDEAEAQFLKLIELLPEDGSGYANLGVVYLRKGDNEQAEKYLLKAIDISPNDPDIRLNLAKVYELKNNQEASLKELKKNEELSPDHIKTLYGIAEKYKTNQDASSMAEWENYIRKIVKTAPQNIVARLYLIESLLRSGKGDEALKNLEEAEQIYPDFPAESQEFYTQALEFLRSGEPQKALTPILIFHNFLKLTPEYQGGIRELKGSQSATIGVPVISFSASTAASLQEGESIIDVMRFTEATSGAGLEAFFPKSESNTIVSSFSVSDMDGDGDHDMYYSGYASDGDFQFHYLLKSDFGKYVDIKEGSGINHPGQDQTSAFVDYDNDGFLDLFICNSTSDKIYRNVSEGVFKDLTTASGISSTGSSPLFVDIDHEGDLDLIVASKGRNSVFRNNGDGSFSLNDTASELGVDMFDTRAMAFGDFDADGDIDIVMANADGPFQLFSNLRSGKFVDFTGKSGIIIDEGSTGVEVVDLDNDGALDLIITTETQGIFAYRNSGAGSFTEFSFSKAINKHGSTIQIYDLAVFDFDNDGYSDILIAGASREPEQSGLKLLRNLVDKFEDVTFLLPDQILDARQVEVADYNQDGDLDIYLVDLDGKLRLLRNDGGNANHHLKVKLVGLRTGSGKNNYYGIGATVEVRAGDLYQLKSIQNPETHFGLGAREKADVVRILWTNGVPQNIFSPGSDQDLIEEQELKGSCPFLYTWDGEQFVFLKDMMWRSALGMPLGIMGGRQAYAFADASEEYLKIPGELLHEKDGKYTIQMTAELWETIYTDEIKLIAVDHPVNTDIYVDEKFAAPPYPALKVYHVKKHHLPQAVEDGKGVDLKSLVSAQDHTYISNFQREKYQGITEMKDLVLDLGDVEDTENLHLFLNGWIFPTDASINVAISQSDGINIKQPSLEVINDKGQWQEVISSIGFPGGKNKTVIVDLANKFLSDERKVRIRTNMEIYWDYIFFAGEEDFEIEMTTMTPEAADIHYRGFSAKSRKGGRYGPHWFDYNDVSTSQKWRDLEGEYTRYGDVNDLLQEADDMYIIANAGDETTISFDASRLPKLREGRKRDFLIYSVGWVKDGDLNTALGQTVEPLPFHGMSQYPYGTTEHFPAEKIHQEYLRFFNTRLISTNGTWKLLPKE